MNQRVHSRCYGGYLKQAWDRREEVAGHVRAGLHFWLMSSVRLSTELPEKLVWFFCDGTESSRKVFLSRVAWRQIEFFTFISELLEKICHVACYTIFVIYWNNKPAQSVHFKWCEWHLKFMLNIMQMESFVSTYLLSLNPPIFLICLLACRKNKWKY